ncbi:MAG: TetR/AcrR family transcriptional regulator [Myxococcota bacterium]
MSELRQKILDASVELVAEKGVRGVSFREVARRAGVSHQAPYHHFGNYQGILEAIGREGFAGLAAAINEASAAAGPDAMQALTAGGVAYIRFARDHIGHFRVMFQRDLVEIHGSDESMPEAEEAFGTLVRMCGEAQAAGYGLSLSAEDMTLLTWSTVHGFANLLIEGVLEERKFTDAQADGLTLRLAGALSRVLA